MAYIMGLELHHPTMIMMWGHGGRHKKKWQSALPIPAGAYDWWSTSSIIFLNVAWTAQLYYLWSIINIYRVKNCGHTWFILAFSKRITSPFEYSIFEITCQTLKEIYSFSQSYRAWVTHWYHVFPPKTEKHIWDLCPTALCFINSHVSTSLNLLIKSAIFHSRI